MPPTNKTFVGRETEFLTIARSLKVQRTSVIATGIGGIGKSSLATEFAHRYGQYFLGGVFWLSFADPAGIHIQMAVCGGKGWLDLHPNFEQLDLADQFALVQRYWASEMPCLLIFDNCEDDELLKFVPTTGASRVLVTSRRTFWPPTARVQLVPLGVLSRAESVAMLNEYFKASEADHAQLAHELDYLPLAMHLAGSYIAHYAMSVAEYLHELAEVVLLEHESLNTDERSVERTFALSYDKLDPVNAVDATAIQLLARAACFAPGEPIPTDLLKATLEADTKLLRKALARLSKELGLLEAKDDAFSLHRLLALFIQQHTTDNTAQNAVEQVMRSVSYELNTTGIPSKLQPLQNHLRWITEQALKRDDANAATLANNLASHLQDLGAYKAARPLYEQSLAICEKIYGKDHPEVATDLNNLAGLLQNQGDYAAARPLFERALAIREQVLGSDHPDTATNLNNLAALLYSQGDYTAAHPLYERALAIQERVFGADHPSTAISLNNLAELLRSQGDYTAAHPLYERALAIREHILGTDHPDTASSLDNLAELLRSQGDYAAARPLYERALAIWEHILGADHPDTATSLNNLAELLRSQGDYAAARPLFERALAIDEKIYGTDHPEVATDLNNLAWLYYDEGDFAQAIELMQRVVEILKKTIPNHPNTQSARQSLEYMQQRV